MLNAAEYEINSLQSIVCYCVSGLAFRYCECRFNFLWEMGLFCEKGSVLRGNDFFVKYFDRELWLKKKKKKKKKKKRKKKRRALWFN